ncbi:cache domain-containing protein [Methanoregula sp.]|uniref:cache domain-containing protein n=1 Tax=Methanoregula sp. TaxID=2052170 RepID=UPI00237471DD|nr:cache domain-containing protein [Methanoregula sp.]MDD1686328.1 cache domain-containing protein [Methanoregula sp.]
MKSVSIIISLLLILSLLLVAAGCTQAASSPTATVPSVTQQSSSKEEMVAFVREAVAYAHTHDKNVTLNEFSNPNGSFVRGDLYIYAYDFNGTTIAHPFSPEKLGVSRINEPDALGTLFITNLRNAAVNGSGFVEFSYKNPANKSIVEKKLGYVEKVDDAWWLGSGIYYGPVGPMTSPSGNNTAASPSRTG